MEIIITSYLEQILQLVGLAIAALVGMGIRYLFARIKSDKLRSYGDLLAFYAEKAVSSVAQAEVEGLKAAAADGKLSDAEKERLKKIAIDTLRAIAPDAILKFMEKGKSDLDMLLGTLVESAVKSSKGDDS